ANNVTWEVSPLLALLAPRYLKEVFEKNNLKDNFISASTGIGYFFPSMAPNVERIAHYTSDTMSIGGLSVTSVLNANGTMKDVEVFVEQPHIDGVLYKDFHAYHLHEGEILWHKGKPIVSFRAVLWENMGQTPKPHLRYVNDPASIAKIVSEMPANPLTDEKSYAVIGIHPWSWRDSGGSMAAVQKTVDLLPKNARIVSVNQLVSMLRKN